MKPVAILVLLAWLGLAFAQDRSSEVTKLRPVVGKQKPKVEQRGTEAQPVFVRGDVTTKKNAEEAASNADERKEKAAVDRDVVKYARLSALLAFLLLLVAIAQAWFFWWQLRMLVRTTKSAEDASAAALLQANASVGIELPVLRALVTDLSSVDAPIPADGPYSCGTVNEVPGRYSAIGFIEIKNYGRTPAFPSVFESGWKVTRSLPEIPTYDHTVRESHAAVIEPDGSSTIGVHRTIELTEQEINAIANNEGWLWFYGCLTYQDFLGNQRKARFCWRWARRNVADSGRYFASDGEPPFAYIAQSVMRTEGGGYI